MTTYQVPVSVTVDTTSAVEARQIVLDAAEQIERDPRIVSVKVAEAASLSLLDELYCDWVLADEQGPVADTDEGEE